MAKRMGGLKGGKNRVGMVTALEIPISLTPGTFYTSPSSGIGKRGIDLERQFVGSQKDGLRTGYGVYKYANGYMTYEGDFVNGMKHGKGKMKFKDGGYYDGDFVKDEMTGQATRKFANGNTFIGTFFQGDMHGSGMLMFKNQDSYEGPMDRNRMHGKGLYKFVDGSQYKGDFSEHRMTGQGTMAYSNGDKYDGSWLDGKRSGQGTCRYANGNNYRGAWADDKFNGQGMLLIAAAGIRYRGLFVDGQPSQVPSKLNLLWQESAEEQKARLAPKKAAPAAKGAPPPEELSPVLPNTLGTPLASPLILAAQLAIELPPDAAAPSPTAAAGAGAKGSSRPVSPLAGTAAAAGKGGTSGPPVADAPPLVLCGERAPAGSRWQTSEMEYGRVAHLTLHANTPQPCPDGSLGLTLVQTLLADGTTTVRALMLPVSLGKPLPLQRLEDGTAIYAREVYLEGGQFTFDAMSVGDIRDFDVLQSASGVGYLVATCQMALPPGFAKVALPDSKAKNPNAPSKK